MLEHTHIPGRAIFKMVSQSFKTDRASPFACYFIWASGHACLCGRLCRHCIICFVRDCLVWFGFCLDSVWYCLGLSGIVKFGLVWCHVVGGRLSNLRQMHSKTVCKSTIARYFIWASDHARSPLRETALPPGQLSLLHACMHVHATSMYLLHV